MRERLTEVVAPDDTHVGDGFAVFIQSLDGCDDVVEMLLRKAAAVDGEAHDLSLIHICTTIWKPD